MKRLLSIAALSLLLFAACKREPSEWDVDIVAPVATATLTIEDVAPDGYVVANGDGSLKVVYQNTIYTLPIDSLLKLPDTTFNYPLNIPFQLGPFSAGANIPAGVNPNLIFTIDPAKLTRVVVKEGTLNLTVKSSATEPMDMHYWIPLAFKNGSFFDVYETIPALTSPTDSGLLSKDYDLAGYDISLKGPNNNSNNQLGYTINGAVSTQATGDLYITAGQRLFNFYTTYKNLKPEYVEGYFGTKSVTQADTATLNLLKNITGGTFDLEDIDLNITLENSIGADVRATIKKLKGINTKTGTAVSLNHPIVNTPLNVDRAVNMGYGTGPIPYLTTTKGYDFNPGNSNITQFISNLPDQYEYEVDLLLNPLGNISGGHDFIYRDAGIKINMNLELPLSFKSNNLTLVDTIDYNINAKKEDVERYQGGSYKLYAYNGFPLQGTVKLMLMDSLNQIIDTILTSSTIAAADVDANLKSIGQKQTIVNFPISTAQAQNLVATKKVIVVFSFSTLPANQYLKLYNTYKLDLKLTSDFKFRMKM